MLNLAGCHVHTLLYESERSRIYRAMRAADVCPLIFKCLNHEQPSPEHLAWFQDAAATALSQLCLTLDAL